MSCSASIASNSPMFTASGKEMGKTGHNRGKLGQIDGRTLAERVASFLRDRHPIKTAQCVAAETAIPANTVRKWLEQGNAPSGPAYDALVRSYGAIFLCAVHREQSDAWFADVARREEQARLERAAATIRQQLAAVMGGQPL